MDFMFTLGSHPQDTSFRMCKYTKYEKIWNSSGFMHFRQRMLNLQLQECCPCLSEDSAVSFPFFSPSYDVRIDFIYIFLLSFCLFQIHDHCVLTKSVHIFQQLLSFLKRHHCNNLIPISCDGTTKQIYTWARGQNWFLESMWKASEIGFPRIQRGIKFYKLRILTQFHPGYFPVPLAKVWITMLQLLRGFCAEMCSSRGNLLKCGVLPLVWWGS